MIAIPGGAGKYSASGSYYNCSSGTCSSTPAGTMTFAIDIDFAAKTLGGGSSSIVLTAPASITGNISSPVSYAGLSGPAVFTFSQPANISSASGDFTGTSIKLLNSGGVTAGAASVDLKAFNTGSPAVIYGGTVGAPLQ